MRFSPVEVVQLWQAHGSSPLASLGRGFGWALGWDAARTVGLPVGLAILAGWWLIRAVVRRSRRASEESGRMTGRVKD